MFLSPRIIILLNLTFWDFPEPWSLGDILGISGIVTFSFAEGMILDALVASLMRVIFLMKKLESFFKK